jgi:hypothetical protein
VGCRTWQIPTAFPSLELKSTTDGEFAYPWYHPSYNLWPMSSLRYLLSIRDARAECKVLTTEKHVSGKKTANTLGNFIGDTTVFSHRTEVPLCEALPGFTAIQLSFPSPRCLLGSIGNCALCHFSASSLCILVFSLHFSVRELCCSVISAWYIATSSSRAPATCDGVSMNPAARAFRAVVGIPRIPTVYSF